MSLRIPGLVLAAAAALLVAGCTSSPSTSVPEGASPSDVYLDAVCDSGQERVVFVLLAQGYQQGQGIPASQVLEAANSALTTTRQSVDILRTSNVAWPESVAEDVVKVAASEEAVAEDLQTLTEADEAGLDAALEVYFARPGSTDGAGERVRSALGLGEPGDCPVSPTSERAFIALIQRYAPTVYAQGDEAVLALGRETCVIMGLNLDSADEIEQVKALGLTDAQAGIVMESAKDYVCQTDTAGSDTGDTTAAVDAILDEMIEGTLILTTRNPQTRPEVISQFEDARARWDGAAALLEAGTPGIPEDVNASVLQALERAVDAMGNVITCLQASTSASCNSEIDTNSELSNALGQELAALIPYGSRTAEEVLAALDGSSSTTGGSDTSGSSSGQESVSQSNARQKAAEYLQFAGFSRQGLIDQLVYEGFSTSDATYGADAVGANWNEQAARKAQEYLNFTAFSRSGLIEQLQFEGFSLSEATYGADAVGL